ncbi:unnamed protein product, partial [Staurois parvus]
MIGADPRSDNCRFSAVLSSRSDSQHHLSVSISASSQCSCMPPASATSMPPISAYQCTSMPHISAHLSCLSVSPISATYQCQSVTPISAAKQCQPVPPISASQCCLSVCISAAYQ